MIETPRELIEKYKSWTSVADAGESLRLKLGGVREVQVLARDFEYHTLDLAGSLPEDEAIIELNVIAWLLAVAERSLYINAGVNQAVLAMINNPAELKALVSAVSEQRRKAYEAAMRRLSMLFEPDVDE